MDLNKNFSLLEKQMEYLFTDKSLLKEALTHPSCNLEKKEKNYERLEFLGDAVLNLIVAELLYTKYREVFEDKLSSMRAKLVSCNAICLVANEIGLGDMIILSQGEERNGGRQNPRNIENTMEALIGAIYLDGGIAASTRSVGKLWLPLIENQEILGIDSKTYLQEWAQKNKYKIPVYSLVSTNGSSHAPIFEIQVEIQGVGKTVASGNNKKEAEKEAASLFLQKFISVKVTKK